MTPLKPYPPKFPDLLADYCRQIREAKSRGAHHDQRRALFMDFLRQAYSVEAREVELEKKIKAAAVRGYIDALYETTIFEFKTDFDRERETGLLELKRYVQSRADPSHYLSVLTDGERFELHQWTGDELSPFDAFILDPAHPDEAFLRIDQLLRTESPRVPTGFDLVLLFGPHSAVFCHAATMMSALYHSVEKDPAVATKFRQWNRLLAKVYGAELGLPDLFIKHTYLVILSRLMVAQALYPSERRNKPMYRGIMAGDYFTKKNLPNLAEPDFFSWAVDTPVEGDFLGLVGRLEKHLAKFDFARTAEDILKELYQGLVDPVDRHDLGEYYTPDWLAELTLEKLDYSGETLLDPSCGSGTFLMCAVRRLREQGIKGNKLVDIVQRNFAGIDVHPLAVLMAKANLLLALGPDARKYEEPIRLPVFMADTLQTEVDEGKGAVSIPAGRGATFHIPFASIDRPDDVLDAMIEEMQALGHSVAEQGVDAGAAKKGFFAKFPDVQANDREAFYWKQNIDIATKLIKQKRNSVWAFILKNAYRPTFLRKRKVQCIAGNPPWLSFRYIKDPDYKERIRGLASELGLTSKKKAHLVTQMELSAIFYRYCEREFLAESGKLGFVLPRSLIIGAKQHAAFQEQGGFSEIIDCEYVENLFNVPTCAILRLGNTKSGQEVPCERLGGRVVPRNASWSAAARQLHVERGTHAFVLEDIKSPHYFKRALQGASLFPRAFWFVEPDPSAKLNVSEPYLRSNSELLKEAKDIWKEKKISVSGRIEEKYLRYTVIADGLLPFAVRSFSPVFLPIEVQSSKVQLADANQLISSGDRHAAAWLGAADAIWKKYRANTGRTLLEWIDYSGKLSAQSPTPRAVILYNSHGTNLTACALLRPGTKVIEQIRYRGFIADSVTYYLYLDSEAEADYLAAALNSESVMEAIKVTMPKGLIGERHIHRRPFEACALPQFEPSIELHASLAALGEACRKKAAKVAAQMEGQVGRARKEMRSYLADELTEINRLVEKLIGAGPPAPKKPKRRRDPDMFSLF